MVGVLVRQVMATAWRQLVRTFVLFFLFACSCSAAISRADYVAQVIDGAVNPGQLPAGFKGMVIGYLDDFGPVYKAYGIATVDGTVRLDEHTLFGDYEAVQRDSARHRQRKGPRSRHARRLCLAGAGFG